MLRDRVATADEVAEELAVHAAELHSLGVRSLNLFGLMARGDARPDSDVDLIAEFKEVPGFVGYSRLRNMLEQIHARRVDLVMASALHPRRRERVLCEAQHVA